MHSMLDLYLSMQIFLHESILVVAVVVVGSVVYILWFIFWGQVLGWGAFYIFDMLAEVNV